MTCHDETCDHHASSPYFICLNFAMTEAYIHDGKSFNNKQTGNFEPEVHVQNKGFFFRDIHWQVSYDLLVLVVLV